jgi:quinol-cytochrome oxidoreductase complex cytochrome b subunit
MNINDSLQRAADSFFGFLPNLLGFLVLLLVGWIIAKVIAGLVRKGTEAAGVDRRLAETSSGRAVESMMPGASAARLIGVVVFWLVFGFFLVAAAGALQVPAVTDFMNRVLAYLPNIVVAVLIFVIAALLAGGVAKGVSRVMGDNPMGQVVAAVAPALIMVLAMFMILEQLNIAEQIVEIAFAATMLALALGLALAFGLGGRSVAERLLEDAYAKGRSDRARTRTTSGGAVPDPRQSETDTQAIPYEKTGTGSATYRETPRPDQH